jgi:hypothetical protein
MQVVLQSSMPWSEAVREQGAGMTWIEGRAHLESGLVSDIAHALDVDRTRIRIANLQMKATSCEVHIIPDMIHASNHSPGCLYLAKFLCAQASHSNSPLRALPSGSILVGGNVQDAAPRLQAAAPPEYKFSMLHGGIIQSDAPHRNSRNVHGVDSDSRYFHHQGGEAAQRDYTAVAMYGSSKASRGEHAHKKDDQEHLLSFRAQGASLVHANRASIQPKNAEYDSESGLRGPAQRDERGFWVDASSGKPMGLTVRQF